MGLEFDDLQGPLQTKPFSEPVMKTQTEEEADLHLSVGPVVVRRGVMGLN